MALDEDPIFTNVSASVIHPSNSDEGDDNNRVPPAIASTTTIKPSRSGDDEDFSLNSELIEDYKRDRILQAKLKEDLARAELNATQLMTELELERAKYKQERDQRKIQTAALIEESNRLRSTADEARFNQEKFRQEIEDRIIRQEKIMLALQQSSSVKSNVTGISSPVKKLLDAYDKLDDTSRQALWNSALATNNTDLQRALFSLRNQSQNLNNTTYLDYQAQADSSHVFSNSICTR